MGSQPEYATGEVIANKYVVEGSLGESPSGRSYLAASGMTKLVIKTCRPDLSARLISSPDFFLKAGVATEVEHDNLVACLDVQEEMGRVFTARAHVEGQDFEQWARSNRREGNYYTRGLELLWQACQGLSALHERSRHLNIHPGNLLVTPLMAKLADWDPRFLGSMEMTPEPFPFRSEFAGYRAPEMQSRGSFLSYPSTDLYAVAGLLYRLVVGEHPGRDPAGTLSAIKGLDEDLARFLGRGMHPRPEERFQEATDFSDALWGLEAAMGRLQEKSARDAARTVAPRIVPPTVAMEPRSIQPFREPAMSGEAPEPATANPAPPATPAQSDDSFFNFFPGDTAAPAKAVPIREATPKTPPPETPSDGTLFGASVSSLEATPSSETLFGAPPEPPRPATPPHRQPSGGLSSLEQPGTLFGSGSDELAGTFFGSEPPPSPPPPRRGGARSEPAHPPLSLASLEKDPLEDSNQDRPGGHTQFGFKNAGESRTLFGEDPQLAAQRKLYLALGIAGAVVLLLALGGLFVYLRSAAAPEVAAHESDPAADPEPLPEPDPAPSQEAAVSSGPAVQPPYPEAMEPSADRVPEPIQEPPRPATSAGKPPSATTVAAPASPDASGAPRGSQERLAELIRMIEMRQWPASASERLKAADELNDFNRVAEANVMYGRVMGGSGLTGKQKVAALGGLAATFKSMGMKDQALDAADQILAINPRNAFALRLKEQLK